MRKGPFFWNFFMGLMIWSKEHIVCRSDWLVEIGAVVKNGGMHKKIYVGEAMKPLQDKHLWCTLTAV